MPIESLLEKVPCDPKKVDQIWTIANILNNLYSPKKIILFGSQAKGTWTKDSDADFMLVGFNKNIEAGQYNIEAFAAGVDIPFDVVLASEERVKKFKHEPSSVYAKALAEGIEIDV